VSANAGPAATAALAMIRESRELIVLMDCQRCDARTVPCGTRLWAPPQTRKDAAIKESRLRPSISGLLRFARNDGARAFARKNEKGRSFRNDPSIVVARASSLGPVTCLWRTLREQILRGGKNPGPVDHTGLMTMRHWITSFRLVDDTEYVSVIRKI
jgi:hypothetical protein